MNFPKIQIILQTYKIFKEIKKYIYINNNNNLLKLNKIIIYNSEIITNIQLSIELLFRLYYKLINSKLKENKILFSLIITELIKIGFKFEEFENLKKLNYNFYIDKKVFYENVLEIDENDLFTMNNININEINYDLSIKPKKGNFFYPLKNNSKLNKLLNNNEQINKNEKNKKIQNFLKSKEKLKNIIKQLDKKYLSEILYIFRPFIYLNLKIRFYNKPLIPFLINILLDCIIFFWKKDYLKNLNFTQQKAYHFEKIYRKINLILYFFREPIYSNIIYPILLNIFSLLHLPNLIQEIINDFLEYFTYFSYTY